MKLRYDFQNKMPRDLLAHEGGKKSALRDAPLLLDAHVLKQFCSARLGFAERSPEAKCLGLRFVVLGENKLFSKADLRVVLWINIC